MLLAIYIQGSFGQYATTVGRGSSTSTPSKSPTTGQTPAADLDQLLGERYRGERLAEDFHQRCGYARTVLRQMTHMGN